MTEKSASLNQAQCYVFEVSAKATKNEIKDAIQKFFDVKVIDGFGPDGISGVIKKFSIKANKFQSGYIYQYAFIMLLGFSAFLTFLIVK